MNLPETKDIPGFPDYAITKDGRVWSKPRKSFRGKEPGRWLINTTQTNGYIYGHLSLQRKEYHIRIAGLILLTYVGLCPKGMECRHLDGNKKNNKLSNLKYGTHKENMQDTLRHGTNCGLKMGEDSNRAILSENQVRLIFNAYHDGAYNQQELADMFNISDVHISRIVNKKTWRHLWVN